MITWFPTGDGKDLGPFLCHDWIECLVSLPFDRGVNCRETGKLILSVILEVIQTYLRISTAMLAAIHHILKMKSSLRINL